MSGPGLEHDELTLRGRYRTASNATFLGAVGDVAVVYKPVAGESPLWDFPDGLLAHREVAAYLVSETLGGGVVPRTWLRDGPLGEGMAQLWQEQDEGRPAVDLVPAEAVPATGWRTVLSGHDESGRTVCLIHEDSPALRRMAVLDVLVNNADRKGDHVLAMPDGHRFGVDHGLTFHAEHKLRTVLWGWAGERLTGEETAAVTRVREALSGTLGAALSPLLTDLEIDCVGRRCERLLSAGALPFPGGGGPAIPWPPF